MKKKVLLVSYHTDLSNAIRILSSLLKEKYDVSKLFMMDYGTFETWKKTEFKDIQLNKIVSFSSRFDYVLISATSYHADITFKISDLIKRKNKKVKVIIGGAIGTSQAQDCLKHADAVCTWEGHNVMDIMDYFEGKKPKDNTIANFIVKDQKIKTKYLSLDNYDDMPFPDYSKEKSYFYIDGKIVENKNYYHSFMNIETAKGCVFRCSFCSISHYNKIKKEKGLPIVFKSTIPKAIERIKYATDNNPEIKSINIDDDNFFFYSVKELENFVELYNKNIDLPCTFKIDPRSIQFNKKFDILSKINKQILLFIGVQSGSDEFSRKVYDRIQSYDKIIEQHNHMLNIISKEHKNISISYFIIYANPYETREDILKTINMMLLLKKSVFQINAYIPIPNTPLGERLKGEYDSRCLTFSEPHKETFRKNSFYYFFYFYINWANSNKMHFLLPKKFKQNFFTEMLNNRIFEKIFSGYLSYTNKKLQREYNLKARERFKGVQR